MALMVASQALLVAGCSDGGTPPALFQIVDVVAPLLLLLAFGVGMHPRGA